MMNQYSIFLSWNNREEGFQLPINPGAIEVSDGGKSKTYDISKFGEINVIKDPKLTEFSFSGIFPSKKYPFQTAPVLLEPIVVNGVKSNPYVYYIQKWMATKRPIRFVFTGGTFDLNEAVSIESFQWKEAAGNNGDIEYTLKLKKYLFYAAKRVSVVRESEGESGEVIIQKEEPERPNYRETPQTYQLGPGEGLWVAAKKTLGDGARWKEIQTLNGITDAQLKKLPAGTVLKIPGGAAIA